MRSELDGMSCRSAGLFFLHGRLALPIAGRKSSHPPDVGLLGFRPATLGGSVLREQTWTVLGEPASPRQALQLPTRTDSTFETPPPRSASPPPAARRPSVVSAPARPSRVIKELAQPSGRHPPARATPRMPSTAHSTQLAELVVRKSTRES